MLCPSQQVKILRRVPLDACTTESAICRLSSISVGAYITSTLATFVEATNEGGVEELRAVVEESGAEARGRRHGREEIHERPRRHALAEVLRELGRVGAGDSHGRGGGHEKFYGLGAGGSEGVIKALEILRVELDRAMGLLGCGTIADLKRRGPDMVKRRKSLL